MIPPNIEEAQLFTRSPSSYDFSKAQLEVLAAVFEAVVPGLDSDDLVQNLDPNAADWQKENAKALVSTSYSSQEALAMTLRSMRLSLSPSVLKGLMTVVSALSTRLGSAMLAGTVTPFPQLSLKEREDIIVNWGKSSVATLRQLYWAFTAFPISTMYGNVDALQLGMGLPPRDHEVEKNKHQIQPVHEFKFMDVQEDKQIIETEFAVIGSGAGGGVVSSELAKAGHKVLVIEKSVFIKHTELPPVKDSYGAFFEGEGVIASEDGSINVFAGSAFGGGTTVNWGASLKPQHFVRSEWAELGMPHFLSNEFNDSLEYVTSRMGVSADNISHSRTNLKMKHGCDRLGFHCTEVPQNSQGGKDHNCGYCNFSCPYGVKGGGMATWLRDAEAHGAQFLQGAHAHRILFTDPSNPVAPSFANLEESWPTSTKTQANGALLFFQNGRQAIVHATKGVVCSSGSLNSPALLLRSKVPGPRIGKNLRLHPVTFAQAVFDERIEPHEGAALTMLSNVSESHDGANYGPKIQTPAAGCAAFSSLYTTWRGAKDHKAAMLEYPHTSTFIVLTRDKGSGDVVIDSTGKPRFNYTLSAYDQVSMQHGLRSALKIFLAAGAKTLKTNQPTVPVYHVPADVTLPQSASDPGFQNWLDLVDAAGLRPGTTCMASAHQMGSLAMGTSRKRGATDPRGRIWGHQHLYVADASLFPTPSGSNPMVTNMATSHGVAQWIIEDAKV